MKYLNNDFSRICIKFHKRYYVIDSDSGDPVKEICANIIANNKGVAEYSDSNKLSTPSTSEEVTMNI